MELKRLNDRDFLESLRKRATGTRLDYRAFYSSFLGGITTEPHHMVVPLDDHMVHRGDGVFEAVKFHPDGVYALDRHLARLEQSAEAIALKLPHSISQIATIILETVRASRLSDGLIRLFLARGPGGFTANPYETIGSQIYCVVTKLSMIPSEKYVSGVRAGRSNVQVKAGFFAQTKTCNYLPNVLMKKEAIDRGLDYVVSVDEDGYLAESSTENFAIFDRTGAFVVPTFERILQGVTAVRAMELAAAAGISAGITVAQRRFKLTDVQEAKGAVMLGTTIDVLPVKSFEETEFGPVPDSCRELMHLFEIDLRTGPLNRRY